MRLISFSKMIFRVKKISRYLFVRNQPTTSIKDIYIWYSKLNKILKIESCFVNALALKIIFSYFGHDLLVVCGVKFDDNSNFKGHAWLSYKNQIIFEEKENLDSYIESFNI